MQKNKKRPDGRVKSKVYLGQVDGKAQYKYVYAQNNRELEKKVQEVKAKLGKGLDLAAERDTFGYWADKWIKVKQIEVSAKRYATYKARAENLSSLNNIEISKIRMSDFQEIIIDCASEPNVRTGKPYALATLSEIKNTAVQIMQLAIDNRAIDFNPALAIKIPKNARKGDTRRALTKEERQWIINFPHRAQTAAMIMMFAGLRRGELMALTWADINLEDRTIKIDKFVEVVESKSYIKDYGKTDAAVRTVYIPTILANYLRSVSEPHFGYVVHKKDGGLMTESAWERMWESYLDDLNLEYGDWKNCIATNGKKPSKFSPIEKPKLIPQFTAHWLRHTFITLMYFAGVDILTAKEQAGHRDIKTTMGIYTHLDEQFKKKNINKLDDYLNDDYRTSQTEQSVESS